MTKDLMFRGEIEELVANAYRNLNDPHGPGIRAYDEDQYAGLPEAVQSWSLGVGNPLPHAGLRPGEMVLDLGSGAGIDVLIAAQQVGPQGRAIGVDMLPEMIERSEKFAAEANVTNAEFVLAKMDDIPLPDESVDVVISNGSINLAARKSRVFAEAKRVLRPGGRLCVSDLTIDERELPPEVLTHPSAWAGWVSGALAERVFVHKLKRVGFIDIEVKERHPFGLEEASAYPLFGPDLIQLMHDLIPEERRDQIAFSVTVTADNPQDG